MPGNLFRNWHATEEQNRHNEENSLVDYSRTVNKSEIQTTYRNFRVLEIQGLQPFHPYEDAKCRWQGPVIVLKDLSATKSMYFVRQEKQRSKLRFRKGIKHEGYKFCLAKNENSSLVLITVKERKEIRRIYQEFAKREQSVKSNL